MTVMAAAASIAGGAAGIADASPGFGLHKHPSTTLVPINRGYDTTVCGTPSNGVALRQSASDTGAVIRQMKNGVGFHVYRTHNSDSGIPVGWALGYVIGGGKGDDGYTKLAYLC